MLVIFRKSASTMETIVVSRFNCTCVVKYAHLSLKKNFCLSQLSRSLSVEKKKTIAKI